MIPNVCISIYGIGRNDSTSFPTSFPIIMKKQLQTNIIFLQNAKAYVARIANVCTYVLHAWYQPSIDAFTSILLPQWLYCMIVYFLRTVFDIFLRYTPNIMQHICFISLYLIIWSPHDHMRVCHVTRHLSSCSHVLCPVFCVMSVRVCYSNKRHLSKHGVKRKMKKVIIRTTQVSNTCTYK